MAAPVPLPVRVLVKGPSTVNWLMPMGGPRSDLGFPRVIEDELAKRGRPSHVLSNGAASEQAKNLLTTWQTEVLNFSPDVIVILDGQWEAVHLFLPKWLERHTNSLKVHNRRVSNFYRKRILRPIWKTLVAIQTRLDRVVDPGIRKGLRRQVVGDIHQYIRQVQRVGKPLVILVDHPPNDIPAAWFPGFRARLELLNADMAAMVEKINKPNVRYLRLNTVIDKYYDGDIKAALPDGFHFTPLMHRRLGQELTHQILEWAATQPHLREDVDRVWDDPAQA